MMTHGLNEELMAGYAVGSLPPAFDLVVSCHLTMNEESLAGVEAYEAVGGAVLAETAPAAVSGDAFAETLARIDAPQVASDPVIAPAQSKGRVHSNGRVQSEKHAQSQEDAIFPAPLRELVGGDANAVKWKRLGGGIKQAILLDEDEASARLLYIPGGAAVPDHGHNGLELTLVLQGAFSDEVDRFARGDLEIATDDLDHQPIAEPGEACICLAATNGPLKFNAFLPRMLQPLFRI